MATGATKQWESYGMIHKLQFGTFYVYRCIMATIDLTAGCVYLGYCLGGWVGWDGGGGQSEVKENRTTDGFNF